MRTLLMSALVAVASAVIAAEPARADYRSWGQSGRYGNDVREHPGDSSVLPHTAPRHWTPFLGPEPSPRHQPLFSAAYLHHSYPISLHGYYGSQRFYGVGLNVESRYGNLMFNFGR